MTYQQSGALRVTVVGDDAWKARLKHAHADIDRLVERAIERGVMLLSGDIHERIGGQHQQIGKGKYSGPQNPKLSGPKPILNKRTGTLFKSINTRMKRAGADSSGQVGTYIEYGKTHEFGMTVNFPKRSTSIKFPKRPFVAPALEEHRETILRDIINALRKAVA